MNQQEKIAILGIKGAFHHQVAQALYPDAEYLYYPTFPEVLQAVLEKKATTCIVALHNKIMGQIPASKTALEEIHIQSLRIIQTYDLPIRHCVIGCPGARISDITSIISHPAALKQCEKYVETINAKTEIRADTASAVKEVVEKNDPTTAAIASEFAANLYSGTVLKKDIQDEENNYTTFAVITRNETL